MNVASVGKDLCQHRIAVEPGRRPHLNLAPVTADEHIPRPGDHAALELRCAFCRQLLQVRRGRAEAPGLGRRDVVAPVQAAGDGTDAFGEPRTEIVQQLLIGADRQHGADRVDVDQALEVADAGR